jgi:hypothetical protein
VYNSIENNNEAELDNNPILTYCNWNYRKNNHIDSSELVSILQKFNKTKLPYYVRIFNETPISTIQHFIDNNNISDDDLKNIWSKTVNISGIRLQKNFWDKYNLSRAS